MEKRFTVIGLAAVVLALSLALVGCAGSNGSAGGSASVDSSTFAGTWQLAEEDGASAADIEKRNKDGFAEFLILQDDGTALYEFVGDYYQGAYEKKSANEASLDVRHWTDVLALQNGVLTAERTEGGTAKFKKIDDATREAYDKENGYEPEVLDSGQPKTKDMNQVLVDDDYCTITAVSAFEKSGSAGYNLTVVNKTDDKLALRAIPDSFTVNGVKQAGRMQDEIPAGQTATVVVSFNKGDVGGLDGLVNVRFQAEALSLSPVQQLAVYDIAL